MRALLLALLMLAAPAHALMPPQYFVHAQLRAAFESANIKVLEMEQADDYWVVPVVLSGPDAWEINDGLATVFNRTFLDGLVRVEVRLPRGERPSRVGGIAGTLRSLRAALKGNPHVNGVFEHNGSVIVELKPKMISFWADNLNDRRGYVHFAPADLFRPFLDFTPFTSIPIHYSYGE